MMQKSRILPVLLFAALLLLAACNNGPRVTPLPELSVSGVTPDSASIEGGATVTVRGANFFEVLAGTGFQSDLAVRVCGVALTELEVVGEPREIIVPPGRSLRLRMGDTVSGTLPESEVTAAGDVVVTRPDGQNVTLEGVFECYDPTPLIGDFTVAPPAIAIGQEATFSWNVASPGGEILSCSLDPGDGSGALTFADCAATSSRTHTYVARGSFTARLTVEDGSGHRQSETLEVNVTSAGEAAALAIESGNGGTATVGATRVLKAKVTDAFGNPVAGHSVSWEITSPVGVEGAAGGTLSANSTTTNASGVASVDWTIGTDASFEQEVVATATGLTGSPLTYTVDAVAGGPAQLVFETQPTPMSLDGEIVAGELFGVTLHLQDQYGNKPLMGDSMPTVTVGLLDNPGDATLLGTKSAVLKDMGGSVSVSFSDLSMETAASGYTLEASVTIDEVTITGESEPFEVIAAEGFRMYPVDETLTRYDPDEVIHQAFAGNALRVRAQIVDVYGNGVPGAMVEPYAVTDGGGMANGVTEGSFVETDSRGVVELVWLLGPGRHQDAYGSLDAQRLAVAYMDGCPEYDGCLMTFRAMVHRRPLAVGDRHAVAIREDGTLASWGDPYSDDLGGDTTEPLDETPTTQDFVAVAAEGNLSAGLKEDGTIEVWGEHAPDVLSDMSKNSDIVAVDVTHVNSSNINHAFVIALKNDGTLVAWGDDTFRQISNMPEGNDFVAVAAGENHAVALRADGSLVSWGDQATSTVEGEFVEISAHFKNTLALTADGEISAWMHSSFGDPPLEDGVDYTAISAGYYLAAALTAGGEVMAWGSDSDAASANGAQDIAAVAAGGEAIVALDLNGSIKQWDVGNAMGGSGRVPTGTFDAPPLSVYQEP